MLYLSLGIIQTILFEAHFIIYVTIRDMFGLNGETLFVFKIIIVILSVSFLLTSFLARVFQNKIVRFAYTVAATWFGFLIYFLLAAALYWIMVFVGGNHISHSDASCAGIFFMTIATCMGIYGLLNANHIRIRHITVGIPSLPKIWNERKAVMLSDIHFGQIKSVAFAEKISKIILNLKPDIMFLVGDVFDGVKTNTDACLSPLGKINPPLGSFFVLGNHEEFEGTSTKYYTDAIRKAGIKVLENEKITIDGVEIIGVVDSHTSNKKKYAELLEKIIDENKNPRILLKHTPVFTDVAEAEGVDLELSGHTHGGQFFPINLITPFIFKNRNYGLSRFKTMTTYTSSGVGTWGPPMRIGTNPEIVVISFENTP